LFPDLDQVDRVDRVDRVDKAGNGLQLPDKAVAETQSLSFATWIAMVTEKSREMKCLSNGSNDLIAWMRMEMKSSMRKK
jgi:hypothetical protein